jgi:hypothetical protein
MHVNASSERNPRGLQPPWAPFYIRSTYILHTLRYFFIVGQDELLNDHRQSGRQRLQTYSDKLIPQVPNTSHSCIRHGPALLLSHWHGQAMLYLFQKHPFCCE